MWVQPLLYTTLSTVCSRHGMERSFNLSVKYIERYLITH